jgi:hypothetical protein
MVRQDIDEAHCFRITKNAPPSQDDFCPQLFMELHKNQKNHNQCDMCGASVFTRREYAIRNMHRFKKLGKYLFCGNIKSNEHGPLAKTRAPHHYNWFQFKGIIPESIFVEKVYENI